MLEQFTGGPMVQEITKLLPVLCALVFANIIAGTVDSIAIEKVKFDKTKMIQGIIKAVAAIAGTYALAYAFDVIDLTSLGFTPMTVITTGVLVYACKLGINLVKILGLDGFIKIKNPLEGVGSIGQSMGSGAVEEETDTQDAQG